MVALFLDGILHRRIDASDDLLAAINFLRTDFLRTHKDVKLVVVDRSGNYKPLKLSQHSQITITQ
jgi:hypothetical protein